MGSRKKLILASLVSLTMVLAFAMGFGPSLMGSPSSGVKAAEGSSTIAISVDGQSPAGDSFAVPVGAEQGFSVYAVNKGAAGPWLATGDVEWSLACPNGVALLSSAPGDYVATVTALAPGDAGLYVSASDGRVAVINLSFYDLGPSLEKSAAVSSVAVTSPRNGTTIILPATDSVPGVSPVTFTAETDSPADTIGFGYVLDGDSANPILVQNPPIPPYAVTIANGSTLVPTSPHTLLAVAASAAAYGQYVFSTQGSFTVVRADAGVDTGGIGGAADGVPDNPFDLAGLNLGANEQWRTIVVAYTDGTGTHYRQVVVLGLGTGAKAIEMPAGGFVATIQDPMNPARVASVGVPTGLLQAGERGALLMVAGDTLEAVTGTVAPGSPILTPPPDFAGIVGNGAYIEVSVVISTDNGVSFSEIDPARLAANPLVLTMEGLSVVAGANARYYSFDSAVSAAPPLVATPVSTPGTAWLTLPDGTLVEDGKMTARLTSLSIFAPVNTPGAISITSLSTQTGSCVGGTSVDITVANLPVGTPTVTFDGVAATDVTVNGNVITVTTPRANTLTTPAASKAVNVEVTVGTSTDVRVDGFTYTGPTVTGGNPLEGVETGNTTVTVTGSGFDIGPAGSTTADLGGVPITIAGGGTSTSFTGTTGPHAPGLVTLTVTTANNYIFTFPNAFLYKVGDPTLTGAIPASAYDDGDYTVRLKGTFLDQQLAGFVAKAYFTYAETGAPDVAVDQPATGDPQIWDNGNADIVTPAHAAGGSQVYLAWQAAGRLITTNAIYFRFVAKADAPFSITEIVPNSGPLTGGNSVEITGDAFPDAKVFFGANEATVTSLAKAKAAYQTYQVITCTAPAGERVGAVDVRIEDKLDATKYAISRAARAYLTYQGEGYTYRPPLSITSLSVTTGSCLGGTTVDITVAGLPAGTPVVTFDGVEATGVSVNGDIITATSPRAKNLTTAAASKAVDVQVAVGAAVGVSPGGFTYTGPTVTSINPTTGPETGGTSVTVIGTGFGAGAMTADLGGSAITILAGGTATAFSGTTTAHAPAVVDLTVRTGNNYLGVMTDAYEYTAVSSGVSIASLSPPTGSCLGGTSVAITMTSLPAGTPTVTFDGVAATGVTVNGSVITVTTPRANNLTTAAASKVVDVQVTVGTAVGTLTGGFTYAGPTVTSINPVEGSEEGGTAVTVNGTGFDAGATTADLGGVAITVAAGGTATAFTGTTGLHAPGVVDLTVTTGNNYLGVKTGAYTYYTGAAPALTAVVPTAVYDDGTYIVRLQGNGFLRTKALTAKAYFTSGATGALDPAVDTAATSTVIWDNTSADVVTPVHAAGASQVYLAWEDSAAGRLILTNALAFTFVDKATAPFTIDEIVPNSGPLGGGNVVQIKGDGFPVSPGLAPVTTGNVVRIGGSGDTVANMLVAAQPGATLTVPVYVYRSSVNTDRCLDVADAPSAISFTVTYDSTLLTPVGKTLSQNLKDWYDFAVKTSVPTPGELGVVVSSNGQAQLCGSETTGHSRALTTIDNQRDDVPDANTLASENPFHAFDLTFTVQSTATAGQGCFLNVADLAMANPAAQDLASKASQPGYFTVGATPTTPPSPPQVKVFFGINEASVSSVTPIAKTATQVITCTAPAGERLSAVDVRVENKNDATKFAISRAGDTNEGGYEYKAVTTPVIDEVAPAPGKGWVFGGNVVEIRGLNFDPNASQVFFARSPGTNYVQAVSATDATHVNSTTSLWVKVPALADASDADPATILADVKVVNPTKNLEGVGTEKFTYVHYESVVDNSTATPSTIWTTAFHYIKSVGAGTPNAGRAVVVSDTAINTGSIPATAKLFIPAGGPTAKTDVPDTYVLARATTTSATKTAGFGTQGMSGTQAPGSWNFDIHLYDTSLAEIRQTYNTPANTGNTGFNTGQLPSFNTETVPSLTMPVNSDVVAPLTIADVKTGKVSVLAVNTTLPLSVSTYNDFSGFVPGDVDPTAAAGTYQWNSNASDVTPMATATNDAAKVTEVRASLFDFSAFSLRTGWGTPANLLPDPITVWGEGPITGGTQVTILGRGLAWYTKVMFGNVDATANVISVDDTGMVITAPAVDSPGEVTITIVLPGQKANIDVGKFLYQAVQDWFSLLASLIGGLFAALFGLAAGGGDDGGGGGPCFIATAAYGTPMADQIDTLRAFRDSYLLNNAAGTAFVELYYRVSPAIASIVAKSPVLMAVVRVTLLPVIFAAKMVLALPHVSALVAMLAGVLMMVRRKKSKA